jgi:hypothetical protein
MSEERWAVRGVDYADRNAAVEAAKRARMTLAGWLGLAIREKIAHEREREREASGLREGEVIDMFETSEPAIAGEVGGYHIDRQVMLMEPMTPPSVADIACMVEVAEKLAELAGRKVKIDRRVAARATRLILARLTAADPARSG